MMELIRPRFLALDTSQLSAWGRACYSPKPATLLDAQAFTQRVVSEGWVPLVSFHHLQELLATRSVSAAATAVRFLSSLPLVGWVKPARGIKALGSVVDGLAAELRIAIAHPALGPLEIRDEVRSNFFHVGTGADLMRPYVDIWRDLQPHFHDDLEERRASASVTGSSLWDQSNRKISELVRGRVRQGEELQTQMASMRLALQKDVALHGDIKIRDEAADISAWFMGIVEEGVDIPPSTAKEAVRKFLRMFDVDLDELGQDATLGEALLLGQFRKQLKIVAESAGLDPKRAATIDPSRLPTWQVELAMSRHRPMEQERKASNAIDAHLAAFGSYADLAFVDGGTWETLRRAQLARDLPDGLVSCLRRSGPYNRALSSLPQ